MDMDEEVMNTAPEMEDSDTVEREDKTAEENSGTTTTSSFIQELNMVLILAFLSLSADEQLDFEEIKQQPTHEYTDSKGKPSVSSSQFRRRQLNIDGFRHPERQISRSHSKMQDCRHGRRV